MFNYICVTHLPAFKNSFLPLKTCNLYYQPVYSRWHALIFPCFHSKAPFTPQFAGRFSVIRPFKNNFFLIKNKWLFP